MSKLKKSGETTPVAYVAKNKQRIKQYDDIVYLNDGDEFQLELFNPTSNKVLAEIELNGKLISGGGIVLRPGERVFLDRYLDTPNKFLFETYMVDGNDGTVKKAIKNNGNVKVKFYNEKKHYNYIDSNIWITEPIKTTLWLNMDNIFYNTTGSITTSSSSNSYFYANGNLGLGSPCPSYTLDVNGSVNTSISSYVPEDNNRTLYNSSIYKDSEIETGIVNKGSQSNQQFTSDNSDFEAFFSYSSEWKILPKSTKKTTAEDLTVYCSNCGRRKRSKENYCPSCGNKF